MRESEAQWALDVLDSAAASFNCRWVVYPNSGTQWCCKLELAGHALKGARFYYGSTAHKARVTAATAVVSGAASGPASVLDRAAPAAPTPTHVWFRGVARGAVVEIRCSEPDLTLAQHRHLIRVLTMTADWVAEDELRAGPEDSCIGRGEAK